MPNYDSPLIDETNPLYCPSVSATAFLRSLRRHSKYYRLGRATKKGLDFCHSKRISSFTRTLKLKLDESDQKDHSFREWDCPRRLWNDSSETLAFGSRNGLHDVPSWEQYENGGSFYDRYMRLKRKRSPSFTDLRGPPKTIKSVQSVNMNSFDVDVIPTRLYFDDVTTEQYPLGPRKDSGVTQNCTVKSDIGAFIQALDTTLPGIRIKERLLDLETLNVQTIADFMAENGYINGAIMDLFRTSGLEKLSLAESLFDENGLNVGASHVFSAFRRENSFSCLSSLSFNGTQIQDSDLAYINHLPLLSTLLLDDTGIGNEAVFILVPLKRSLTHLSLAENTHINDDAVPAFVLLSKLSFLSVMGTCILVPGLRRLSNIGGRNIDLKASQSLES